MPSQEVRKEGCWPVLLPFQAFPPSDIDADDRRVTTDTQSPPMEDGSQGAGSPCTAIVQAEPVPPPRPQQALGLHQEVRRLKNTINKLMGHSRDSVLPLPLTAEPLYIAEAADRERESDGL